MLRVHSNLMVRDGLRAALPCQSAVGIVAVAEDDGSLRAAANTGRPLVIVSGVWRPPGVLRRDDAVAVAASR